MQTNQQTKGSETSAAAAKPGWIARLVNKLDASMKAKADQKATPGCCCDDGKGGGKCC